MGINDGTKDLLKDLKNFKGWMDLYVYTDVVTHRAFQVTMTNKARAWYNTFRSYTTNPFSKFEKQFLSHFSTKNKMPKTLAHLLTLQ